MPMGVSKPRNRSRAHRGGRCRSFEYELQIPLPWREDHRIPVDQPDLFMAIAQEVAQVGVAMAEDVLCSVAAETLPECLSSVEEDGDGVGRG